MVQAVAEAAAAQARPNQKNSLLFKAKKGGTLPFCFITMNKELPTLEAVDAFEVPEMLIPRIAKEHDYSVQTAEALLREAKRMLYLSIVIGGAISPSVEIDDAWHEMLMFTRFYREFADFIGGFIHHDPTPGPPDGGRLYAQTKENYEKAFGIKPDPRCWT